MTADWIDLEDSDPASVALIELCCLMTHPDDGKRRDALRAWLLSKLAADASLSIPMAVTNKLIEAAGYGVGDDMADATAGGFIAGETLLVALELRACGIEDAGIEKAQHVVSILSRTWVDQEGARYRATKETIRAAHWRKYRRVAHLWAAFVLMLKGAEAGGVRDDLGGWLNPFRLAAIANGIREIAGGSILPADALQIVGIEPADVKPGEAGETVIKALESYSPRNRYASGVGMK